MQLMQCDMPPAYSVISVCLLVVLVWSVHTVNTLDTPYCWNFIHAIHHERNANKSVLLSAMLLFSLEDFLNSFSFTSYRHGYDWTQLINSWSNLHHGSATGYNVFWRVPQTWDFYDINIGNLIFMLWILHPDWLELALIALKIEVCSILVFLATALLTSLALHTFHFLLTLFSCTGCNGCVIVSIHACIVYLHS